MDVEKVERKEVEVDDDGRVRTGIGRCTCSLLYLYASQFPSSSVASEFWSLFIIYLPSSTPPCFRMAVRPSGVSPYCRDVNFSMPLILRFYFLGTIDP